MLFTAIRVGHEPMCHSCREALIQKLAQERRELNHSTKVMGRRDIDPQELLYFREVSMLADILEALVDEFGPMSEEPFSDDAIDPYLEK